jgi:hypothetical protein
LTVAQCHEDYVCLDGRRGLPFLATTFVADNAARYSTVQCATVGPLVIVYNPVDRIDSASIVLH